MARQLFIAISLLGLISVCPSASPGGEQSASQPCVILKRMGPADEVTSHLYSFGIRGKQYQFVEGKFPDGYKFHGRLTDHDIRRIEEAGGKVALVEVHYTEETMEGARRSCAAAPTDLISVGVKFDPDAAEITVDGKFAGSTPSVLRLGPGDHMIAIQKTGFKTWQRTMTLTIGETPSISTTLEQDSPHPQ